VNDIILELIGLAAGVGSNYTTGTPQALLKAAGALDAIIIKAIEARKQVIGQLINPDLIQPVPLDPGSPSPMQPTPPQQ
jgi:hypothetical protein